MKRLHLFEFNDLAWFPTVWRNLMTDYLHFVEVKFEMFKFVAPKVNQVLEKCGTDQIVDLCSGATGPVIETQKWLEMEFGREASVTLTDLYPNLDKFQAVAVQNKRVDFAAVPIEATRVPAELKGIRTLFNAFHHFKPREAQKILANAAQEQKGIAVFDATERTLIGVLSMFLTPLIVWLVTPFIRPLTLPRILWTYLIPVIPLAVWWDGMVSALRTYSPAELKEMSGSMSENYTWESGQIPVKGNARITYLAGYPSGSSPETT